MNINPIKLLVFDVVSVSWEKVRGCKGTFWLVLLTLVGVRLVGEIIVYYFDHIKDSDNSALLLLTLLVGFLIICASLLITIILSWGLTYLAVQRALGLPVYYGLIKHVFSLGIFWRMIVLWIFSLVVYLPALILLFLPSIINIVVDDAANPSIILKLFTAACYIVGVVLAVFLRFRLSLASVSVIVEKTNPWAAIEISFKATKSNVWRLIGLQIINWFIVSVSIILLGIGLIWTLPYYYITEGEVYKRLVLK